MNNQKRPRRALAAMIAVMLGLGTGRALAADSVRLQLDWFPSGEHAAYYAGLVRGVFAAEGIDLAIARGYGAADTAAKLAGNVFDFGVTDLSSVLTARARTGLPAKAIAILYRYPPDAIFVLESSGIASLRDLSGKRIGAPPGGTTRALFPFVAQREHLDLNKITWVNSDAAALGPQLIAHRIDAAAFYSIHADPLSRAAAQSGERIRVLPYVDSGFTIYGTVLAARDETLAARPDVTRRFLRAVRQSFEFAQAHPEETCQAYLTKVPEDSQAGCVGTLKATLALLFNPDEERWGWGRPAEDRLAATWQATAEVQKLDPKWDPAQAVDISFLPADAK